MQNMSEETVLVTGATGLLGRQVVKAFENSHHRKWSTRGTGWSRADGTSVLKVNLESSAEVEKALDDVKYVGFPL